MTLALDTSAAVPMVMASHVAHRTVRARLRAHDVVLTQHSLAETYSVLTRLPGDARVAPADAVHLVQTTFGPPALLPADVAASVPALLAEAGIVGGAVYDGLVALAARAASLRVATRDLRAATTYAALGVEVVEIVDEG